MLMTGGRGILRNGGYIFINTDEDAEICLYPELKV